VPAVNFSRDKKDIYFGDPPATAKYLLSQFEGRRQGARASGHGDRDLLQYHNTT
jgi:hypothetical protein